MKFKEFKERIEKLANCNANDLSDIELLIAEYYRNLGVLEHESDNMYVVRASKNGTMEIFKDVYRCSYNPDISKIPLQRCNYPNQQVFYCSMFTETEKSSTSMTCILETALEQVKNHKIKKAYYTLSRWDLKRKLNLVILPFSKLSNKQNSDFRIMGVSAKESLMMHENRKEIIAAYTYMSEVFCKRRNKKVYYKISSAYFNYIMKLPNNFDGIAYPSANTEASGLNVALKKTIVDDGILVFLCASLYRLRRNDSNIKDLSAFPCSHLSFPDIDGNLTFKIDEEAKIDLGSR